MTTTQRKGAKDAKGAKKFKGYNTDIGFLCAFAPLRLCVEF